jgi:ABC-type lipopolysaccharide export system ATPase subunit
MPFVCLVYYRWQQIVTRLEIEHLVKGQIYVVSGSAPNDVEVARVVSLMVDPLVLDMPHVRGL